MKTIAVLIDFTEGAKTALNQAILLANKNGATVYGINIAETAEKVHQSETDLRAFLNTLPESHAQTKIAIGVGTLFTAVPSVLKKIDPDLVLVCTHGVKGMFQHLFGAHILKLVQVIPFPSIVIQENNRVDFSNINKILMPIGPHPFFEKKIRQTVRLAKAFGAEIIVYEIDKPGLDADNQMEKNRQLAKDYFTEHGITYNRILDDLRVISAGFSRQTLEYAVDNKVSLISLMATISKNDVLFGVGDKENFLVNNYGIPVLCCHE
jgi:nucleotide-binding universal stress UspA family protein